VGTGCPGLFLKVLFKIMNFLEFGVLLPDRSKIEGMQIKKVVFTKE
jgi:hypothetical protein